MNQVLRPPLGRTTRRRAHPRLGGLVLLIAGAGLLGACGGEETNESAGKVAPGDAVHEQASPPAPGARSIQVTARSLSFDRISPSGSAPTSAWAPSLARAEARIGLEVLLERLDSWELIGEPDEVEYEPSFGLHGTRTLPLRLVYACRQGPVLWRRRATLSP